MEFQENIDVEFKEMYSKSILKEVVAFANTDGGVIYIGIKDEGTVVGVSDSDDIMLKVSNILRDNILPEIIPFIQIETVSMDEKPVVKITVAVGSERPYYIREKGLKPEGVFVRRGSACQPLSVSGIKEIIVETSGKSYEEGRSLNQKLTFDTFSREMALRNLECGESQFKTLHLIGSDGLYTNLAYLLSDQCPYTIKVAIFNGKDKTNFRDRKEFCGSLLKQLNDVYGYLDMFNKTEATFSGLLRIDNRDYPPETLREALLNSIMHRDYTFSGSTIINMFDDHIEFSSLGGLVSGLSMDAIFMGVSQSRNPNLAAVLYRMKLVESYGTGIEKIKRLYSDIDMQPEFYSAEGAFQVKLYNKNEYQRKEKKIVYDNNTIPDEKPPIKAFETEKNKILNYIKKNGKITRKEAEAELQCKSTKAYRLLKELTEDDLVISTKSGKNNYYVLK